MAPRYKSLNKTVSSLLCAGGVGVIPTDTIYGIVGRALDPEVVERIYSLRERNLLKPMIILVGSISDIKKFGIKLDARTRSILGEVWPAPTSVILPLKGKKYQYLHRGSGGLAFRLPAKAALRKFLSITGPLVAPSANIEGMPPARNISEAKAYFGDAIDFYVSSGTLGGRPSSVIKVQNGDINVLR